MTNQVSEFFNTIYWVALTKYNVQRNEAGHKQMYIFYDDWFYDDSCYDDRTSICICLLNQLKLVEYYCHLSSSFYAGILAQRGKRIETIS